MSTTNKAIEMLAVHHKSYIDMAKAIAGNNAEIRNYAEDYVQEAYLRLMRYEDLFDKVVNKEKVSKGYMFFCLRSIIINSIKKKSNLKFDHLGDQYDFEEKFNWIDNGMDLDRLAEELIEAKMYKVVRDNSKIWFDYELLKTYLKTGKSFRTISEESGIGIRTIYLSIKRSKMLIAEHLYEDYQDFLNGDIDKI